MDNPLCGFCSSRVLLCPACQSKYESGNLTQADIELSRLFHEFDINASFHHALDSVNFVYVFAPKNQVGEIIGAKGVNLEKLRQALGKDVKVVGEEDPVQLARDLVAPAQVVSVSDVHTKDGESLKITVKEAEDKKSRVSFKDLAGVLYVLTGKKTQVILSK
ncbi:MAG: hypothetical protein GF334_05555 [Candidatus Altiarchaeales archaeon]|nr:hypothetical protein [Candidatus Altiarchaeales archaeon]